MSRRTPVSDAKAPRDGRASEITLESELTCPECGHRSRDTMPTDRCQYFHDCAGCGAVLKPKPGDCCVYCSYGTVPCPPVQAARARGDDGCCGQAGSS